MDMEQAKAELLHIQGMLHAKPGDPQLASLERNAYSLFCQLQQELHSSLQQKAKLNWVRFGDDNSAFFYHSMKHKNRLNRIMFIRFNGREISDPFQVQQAFYEFYYGLFCFEDTGRVPINLDRACQGPILSMQHHSLLDLQFTPEEIKRALWSIPDNKAPGLDGFNSCFYKASWEVVGKDLVRAVSQFFSNGKLKSWNMTTITLIPKVPNPQHPGDFRPISCCHVLYKVISKLICSKLKLVLDFLVDPAQGAFVAGRSIMHNILLCQDLVKQYHRKHYAPTCLIKIDL